MERNEIFIGRKVYTRDLYGRAFRGMVTEISWNRDGALATVDFNCFADRDGNERYDSRHMTLYKKPKELYPDCKSVYDIIDAEIEAEKASYKKDIHTVSDLLSFPLKHPFGPEDEEEDQNEIAIQAYLELCQEMMGVRINEHGDILEETEEQER